MKGTLVGRMRVLVKFFLAIGFYIAQMGIVDFHAEAYEVVFSTYLGGSDWEHARDVVVDKDGSIIVVGGTASSNFPVTQGVFQQSQDKTGSSLGSGGYCDCFIAKYDPNGRKTWATYLGGPNYDRCYGVEVDSQGDIYVAGRAGPGFPTTNGSFQKNPILSWSSLYGQQNGFVAKVSSDGTRLIWASYVGASGLVRDIAVDPNGNIYLPLGYWGSGTQPTSTWFANAFQKVPQGGIDCGVIKISNDGSSVIWATYLGGSADDYQEASIRVDSSGCVHILIPTKSLNIPTTIGAYDSTHNGGVDFYIAKLNSSGSDLIFGTFLGGSGNEWNNTHNLALDKDGNVYVSVDTGSSDFPITPGAFQSYYSGNIDMAVAKFSSMGNLIASTFIGGSDYDNTDGIYVDGSGNVYLSGATKSGNFPITSDAYQSTKGGGSDVVLIMLSADFKSMMYSTYLGGRSDDYGRGGFLDGLGNLYVEGESFGVGFPTVNAAQGAFAGGSRDVILAKFKSRSAKRVEIDREISNVKAGSTAQQQAKDLISGYMNTP
jgi:hypothetical protein